MKTQSRKKRKKRVRQAKIKRGVKHFSKALLAFIVYFFCFSIFALGFRIFLENK